MLARKLRHIRKGDFQVMGLADLMTRLTRFLSLFGQPTPVINLPLLLWSESRSAGRTAAVHSADRPPCHSSGCYAREYHADLNAALLTGDPEGLARALVKVKIEHGSNRPTRVALPGWGVPKPSWPRTYPPTQEGVRRLLALEGWLVPLWSGVLFEADAVPWPQRRRLPRYHWSGLWYCERRTAQVTRPMFIARQVPPPGARATGGYGQGGADGTGLHPA